MLNHFLQVGMLVKITKPTGLKWYILAIVEFNKNSKNLYKLQSEEFGTSDHNKTDCMKTAMVHYDTIVISTVQRRRTITLKPIVSSFIIFLLKYLDILWYFYLGKITSLGLILKRE